MDSASTYANRIPELVLFIGIQATGKTSFFREQFLVSHVRISLDLLRTRHREARFLAVCIETRMDTVVDNTNPTKEDRIRYIAPAKTAGFAIRGFYFQSRAGEALARNAQRVGRAHVPEAGILGCARRLQVPDPSEGFDVLRHVSLLPDGSFLIQEWNDGL
ncbi:hypothetical protein LBMAG53_09990 [Planctomycetota bacterium]|nr:hypothetical protein LBMAG53_09990 [Planctomycetota bacterium]